MGVSHEKSIRDYSAIVSVEAARALRALMSSCRACSAASAILDCSSCDDHVVSVAELSRFVGVSSTISSSTTSGCF